MPKYPHIRVRLTGTEGNAVVGVVLRALLAAGVPDAVRREFFNDATRDHTDVLDVVQEWVEVEGQ